MSREWHNGPPPHVGWWEASWCKNTGVWRWWDGKQWGDACAPEDSPEEAAKKAGIHAAYQENIEWTHHYPENARVPRIAPKKGEVMQPTMKLRILRKKVYCQATASTGYAPPVYKDTWQQWWEGRRRLEGLGPARCETIGEWRDVPIVTE